jgi:hypothetical protein
MIPSINCSTSVPSNSSLFPLTKFFSLRYAALKGPSLALPSLSMSEKVSKLAPAALVTMQQSAASAPKKCD